MTRVSRMLGRRGRSLLFFGLLDLVYAISLANPDKQTTAAPFFVWLDAIAPLWCWSLLWAITAAACLIFAFRQRDRIGFAFAIALKVLWGLVSLSGWLSGVVDRGYVSAAIWLALAAFVWVLAGWPEPPEKGIPWTRPSL